MHHNLQRLQQQQLPTDTGMTRARGMTLLKQAPQTACERLDCEPRQQGKSTGSCSAHVKSRWPHLPWPYSFARVL